MAVVSEIVSTTDNLKSLAEALRVTDLNETLSSDGPFTLFAPTDAAFAELGPDRLIALVADNEELTYSLLSHVIAGKYSLSKLGNIERLTSGAESELYISVGDSGELYVEEARVVKADIEADNGIIHVIDVVILPLAEEMLDSMDAGPIAS